MKKKAISFKVFLILILLLLLGLLFIGSYYVILNRLSLDFQKRHDNTDRDNADLYKKVARIYESEEDINTADIEILDYFFNNPQVPVDSEIFSPHDIVLPIDVDYYAVIDGKKSKVYTIRKGTVVRDSIFFPIQGAGIHTYPTKEKGWRYAKPFTLSEGASNDCWFFVKADTISKIILTEIREFHSDNKGYPQNIVSYMYLTRNDFWAYFHGVYFSPDLKFYDPRLKDITGLWKIHDLIYKYDNQ